MKHGKTYRNAVAKTEVGKEYTPEEAVTFLKANKTAKFDESVEVHVRLGINPKKSDEMVRATVILPHGTGRTQKVDIKNGKLTPGVAFDVILATPEMMPKLAVIAKILGPKGMMPSPKTETVTVKIKEAVEMLKKGKKVSFKNDDTGNLHQVIGKTSFTVEQLTENYQTFRELLDKSKPENMKGKLIKRISICSTMGPSLTLKA